MAALSYFRKIDEYEGFPVIQWGFSDTFGAAWIYIVDMSVENDFYHRTISYDESEYLVSGFNGTQSLSKCNESLTYGNLAIIPVVLINTSNNATAEIHFTGPSINAAQSWLLFMPDTAPFQQPVTYWDNEGSFEAKQFFYNQALARIPYSNVQKLATPTGLNADNITSDSARVSWTAVENASGYKVEYRRQGDTTWNE